METIKCSPALWAALKREGLARKCAPSPRVRGRLGGWALRLFDSDGEPRIIALNEATCLTLLLPGEPCTLVHEQLTEALHGALIHLGVNQWTAAMEANAVRALPFAPLRQPAVTQSLRFIEDICECELAYTGDIRRVQWNLNALPHPRAAGGPAESVRLFFAGDAIAAAEHVH
jgi:hypothetical protein